ncbi:MAG: DsbA family protein [Hyphomicrobiales bacterium]
MTVKRLCLVAASFAIGLSVAFSAVRAEDALFNDAQKQEMHKIIRDYLVQNPNVLREAIEALEKQAQEQELARSREGIKQNADLVYRSKRGFVFGNPDGNVTVVEFFDYNCGFCKRSLDDILALVKADPDLKLILKEFPILGEGSVFAARAAIASKKQDKYWDLHLAMMQHRGALDETATIAIAKQVGLDIDQLRKDMDDDEVAATINESMQLAQAVGINGTPAFIIDDRLIPGALGLDTMQSQIAEIRKNGGCAVC